MNPPNPIDIVTRAADAVFDIFPERQSEWNRDVIVALWSLGLSLTRRARELAGAGGCPDVAATEASLESTIARVEAQLDAADPSPGAYVHGPSTPQ